LVGSASDPHYRATKSMETRSRWRAFQSKPAAGCSSQTWRDRDAARALVLQACR